MENKRIVLITIIILLLLFIPLTVISAFVRVGKNPLDENPGHDFKYKESLWFYDSKDKFLSSYECQTKICDYASTVIDDDTYEINYYKNGTKNKVDIIDNKFTFINDGALIYLYSVDTGITLQTYKSIKNYNTELENNTYIIQNNDGLWGALTIGNQLSVVVPFEYDFIGLINKTNDNILKTNKFIVLKNSKWMIIDNNNSSLNSPVDYPIIDYNDDYIFTKNDNKIKIFSYENYEYLSNYTIRDYILLEKYIGIITDNFLLIYDNLGESYLKSITLTNESKNIDLEIDGNNLNIKIDNNIVDTIATF